MRGIRIRRPSPAMVLAAIALIVALGGTAFAGPVAQVARLVSGDRLIKQHSLSGNRLRSHTLTGAQIDLAKLGVVPRANHANTATSASELGGITPAGFVRGGGDRLLARRSLTPVTTGETELLTVPGFIDVTVGCFNSSTPPLVDFLVHNLTAAPLDVVRTVMPAGGPVSTQGFSAPPAGGPATETSASVPFVFLMDLGSGNGSSARVATLTGWANNDGGTCRVNTEVDFNR